jgi:hypothetical protein
MSSAFRREQERQKAEREAARREAALEAARERAREEQREREKEEERREEARAEARAEAAAELKKAERAEALRVRQRRLRLEERRRVEAQRLRELARREAARAEATERARAEALERARADALEEERREAARLQALDAARKEQQEERRREEQRASEQEEARRDAARARALDRARAEERERERRNAAREEARAAARVDAIERARAEAEQRRRAERLDAARAESRELERQEAARAEAREAARVEAQAAARAEARRADRRDADRQALREEQRAARRRGERGSGGLRGPRVPSGVLSNGLRPLRADRAFLVDDRGNPITLRGVTARGLERAEPQGDHFAPALDGDDSALLAQWDATAVTIPISQDLAFAGRGDLDADDYLAALDSTIAVAASAGLYSVVQLSLLASELPTAPGAGSDRFSPPVPDADSIDLWGVLSRRYADEPAVAFDLFRSPHTPDPGDATGLLLPQLTWPIWTHWALAMIGEIRRARPDGLILVRGLDHGRDTSAFPLRYADGTRISNVLYAGLLEVGASDVSLPALGRLARRAPVIVSPWRARPFEERAVESLGRRIAAIGAHWFADAWRDADAPLVVARAGELAPTMLGRAFRNALSQPLPAAAALGRRVGPVRCTEP